MKHYQAIIIGFGKAGKTLAATLAKRGWSVAIIEQSHKMYGGTCINIGCIPTKMLVYDAQQQHEFVTSMQRKNSVVELLRDKNYHNLHDLSEVDVIDGHGEFVDAHTIRVINENLLPDSQAKILTGERIFINTGALPNIPDIEGLKNTFGVYDSTGLLDINTLPKRLGILGGGYIGVEFASMFAQFGSQVTIFEPSDQFLAREDRDIASSIASIFKEANIELLLNTKVVSVANVDDAIELQTDQGTTHTVDVLLVASGRKPATEHLHLHNADLKVNDRGAILVDEQLKTSIQHIWALGDVNGGPQFTYISLDDFRIVHDQLFGSGNRKTTDRQNIPYSVFMTPPLSRVGLTEQQALDQGLDIQTATLPVTAIPRARIQNDTRGVLKAVVDKKTQQIIGVSLLCPESHEMINLIKTVMDAQLPYTVLRDQIFTHPTMSEAFNDLFSQLALSS